MNSITLPDMRKPATKLVPHAGSRAMSSKERLAENLARLMSRSPEKDTPEKLSAYCRGGTSPRTIANMRSGTYDPWYSLDDVAKALGIEPWVLLFPSHRVEHLDIMRVYEATDEQGRSLIRLAVEAAKKNMG